MAEPVALDVDPDELVVLMPSKVRFFAMEPVVPTVP